MVTHQNNSPYLADRKMTKAKEQFIFHWTINGETTIIADDMEEARRKFEAMSPEAMLKGARTNARFTVVSAYKNERTP